MGQFVKKLCMTKTAKATHWNTNAGIFETNKTCKVQFTLPEFNTQKLIEWKMHVDDSTSSNLYDMIIGTDLMTELGIKSFDVSLKNFLHRLFDTFSHHFVNFISNGSLLGLHFLAFLGAFSQRLCIIHCLHTLSLLLHHLTFVCGVKACTMKQTHLLGRDRQQVVSSVGTLLSRMLTIGFIRIFL